MSVVEEIKEFITYLQDSYYTYKAFFIGCLLIFVCMNQIEYLIIKVIPNKIDQIAIVILVILIWFIWWVILKYKLPKGKKNRINIVISIETENDKQKVRLKNDFARRLKEQINNKKLGSIINISILNNCQTGMISNLVDRYSDLLAKSINEQIQIESLDPILYKEWQKMQKSIQGHFFIWGSIKERDENKYYIDLEALVVHNPVNIKVHREVTEEFLNIWSKRIIFEEKMEFEGFLFSADLIFLSIEYMVGIAAYISRDPLLALELHQNCLRDLSNINPLPPNLAKTKERCTKIIADESLIIARWYYFKDDRSNMNKYLEISFRHMPHNYGGYLLKSILYFEADKIDESLDAVYEAKKYAEKNGTWRYNEGFLLMYKESYEEAINVYRKISEHSFLGEDMVVKEVCAYNEKYLKENPEKIQSLYVLGYLKYKKESNYPESWEHFTLFMKKAGDLHKYKILTERARSYKVELERIMDKKK